MEQVLDPGQVLPQHHQVDLVPGLDPVLAPGDDGPSLPDDGGHHVEIGSVALAEIIERLADKGMVFPDHIAQKQDPAVGELGGVKGVGDMDQLEDLFGHGPVGADQKIDPQGLLAERARGQEVFVAHPGDPGGDLVLPGHETGHQVDLVGIGDRDEQIGFGDTGLGEDPGRGPAAVHGQDVEFLFDPGQFVLVPVNEDHFLALAGEFGAQVMAHQAGADDHDPHLDSLRRSPASRPRTAAGRGCQLIKAQTGGCSRRMVREPSGWGVEIASTYRASRFSSSGSRFLNIQR